MIAVKKCAACGKEKPVSGMKLCMHNQMHRYVCDSKCMDDFYNPTKKPPGQDIESSFVTRLTIERDQLRTANQRLEGEVARLLVDAARWKFYSEKLAVLIGQTVDEMNATVDDALSTANGEVAE